MNAGQIVTVSVTLPFVTATKILIITRTIAMRLKSWLAARHPLDTSQLIATSSMQSPYDVPRRAGGPTFSVKCKSYIHTKCTVVSNLTYSEPSKISTTHHRFVSRGFQMIVQSNHVDVIAFVLLYVGFLNGS